MPKDTFINLSEEKKKRIFEAAVQEFSTRRFQRGVHQPDRQERRYTQGQFSINISPTKKISFFT